jgi:hypothetical protein
MTAKVNTDVDAGQSAGATSAAQQMDYGTNRAQDVDKDTGTDERLEVTTADRSDSWFANGKRTYDLHQTLDTDAILQARKQTAKIDSAELTRSNTEAEQRIRHTEAEFNQRMRHADRMDAISNSVIAGLLGDMSEKLGRIEKSVSK